jgi:MinD-like ATPase involved in chromosome partitioning or flagellar assembly
VPLEQGSGGPGLADAGAEPDDAGDPYGTPDDYDTADAYGSAEEAEEYDTAVAYDRAAGYGTADPYGPRGSLAAIGLAPDDYDAGDEYQPPDDYGESGPDSPLSLILNSGAPPSQFGSRPPPAAESRSAEPEGSDAGPAELGTPGAGSAAWAGPKAQPPPLQSPALPASPQPQPRPGPQPPSRAPRTVTADNLTTELLLPGRHKAPSGGWRRAIFEVTGGLLRPPESAAERRRRELIIRASTPVRGGHHRVAVLSLKGGVGKTTTTVGLGSTLASLRGDRVIAVDANPDRGTLSDKLRLETTATVRDLVSERDHIQRYADVRAYTTQAASRLEVLTSDRDPTVTVAFSGEDYRHICQVLEQYYSICITDCGTGLLHSAMAGVLRLADQIVLVSSPSVDGARSASATLDWLQAHGYGDLVRHAVVVLSVIRPRGKSAVDLERLEQHFAARCRTVVRVPYDPHLAEGAEVELGLLNRATADAYLMLAAEIGDGFASRPRTAQR